VTYLKTPLADILRPEGPYDEVLLMEGEHPDDITGHVCIMCGRRVDTEPCPDHAPRDVPGLTLLECGADPRHWLWTLAGDYYPPPCWRCEHDRLWQADNDRRDAPHRRWRHRYARTEVWRWLLRAGRALGLVRVVYARTCPGGGWCHGARWRWSR
jgi:hypothetical protein